METCKHQPIEFGENERFGIFLRNTTRGLTTLLVKLAADFLRRHQAEIHGAWSPLRAKLAGHKFSAMKVETESLAQADPFKLLMRGLPLNKLSI